MTQFVYFHSLLGRPDASEPLAPLEQDPPQRSLLRQWSGVQPRIVSRGPINVPTITALPTDLVRHLKHTWYHAVARPMQPGKAPDRGYRAVEAEWLLLHRAELADHRGRWIVLEGQEILASEENYQVARGRATQAGVLRPLIFFVPSDSDPFIGV